MSTLFGIWNTIQTQLFPWLEEELDPLSDKEREFVQVVSLLDLPSHMKEFRWRGFGRKKKSRINMAKAFVAKSVYKFETTDILIEYLNKCKNIRRLCGWELACEIPSSATFSRAFAEFATYSLAQKIHEAMVKKHCGQKLAGHISRDATAIEARERPVKTETSEQAPKPKGKRGRPCKGEVVPPKPPKRVELQCRPPVTLAPKRTAKGTRKPGSAINFTLIASMEIFPSAPFFHRVHCMIPRLRYPLRR